MYKFIKEKVSPKDITFVIQGPFKTKERFFKCIDSLKKFYPESYIIISTYKFSFEIDIKRYKNTKLLFNEDVGEIEDVDIFLKNFNRMIKSTSLGLQHSRTTFSAKLRSDFLCTFYYQFFEIKINKNLKSYKNKIMNENSLISMCMDNLHYKYIPYQPSDWFHFGRTNILKNLWDKDFQIDQKSFISKDCNFYLDFQKNYKNTSNLSKNENFKNVLSSEQYLYLNYLRKMKHGKNCIKNEYNFLILCEYYIEISEIFYAISRAELPWRSDKHIIRINSSTNLNFSPWKISRLLFLPRFIRKLILILFFYPHFKLKNFQKFIFHLRNLY